MMIVGYGKIFPKIFFFRRKIIYFLTIITFGVLLALSNRYYFQYGEKPRLIHILLWNSYELYPFTILETGQKVFIRNKCPIDNCKVTINDLNYNPEYFDVVMFNGRDKLSLPPQRHPNQIYVYANLESAGNYPACNPKFDGFFNMTFTYRLDSDTPFPYFIIRNKSGEIIGPKIDMHWDEDVVKTRKVDESIRNRIPLNRTKAAAWFVSNCRARSGRSRYVKSVQIALKKFGLTVDVYGKCGKFKCTNYGRNCISTLGRDYFFYMAMENSFAEDYVTEKLLIPLDADVIPIVLGGANYSRFLPPRSYLDATEYTPTELAKVMYKLIRSRSRYLKFFYWKSHYTYESNYQTTMCSLCADLNKRVISGERSDYINFRSWWYPTYMDKSNSLACGHFKIVPGTG